MLDIRLQNPQAAQPHRRVHGTGECVLKASKALPSVENDCNSPLRYVSIAKRLGGFERRLAYWNDLAW